ncbi:MAG: YifB family Mg chelatase-like AAA ATPase [Epulopiscium sp.]|nr:YifB family Mg chelatase-like AAA ATPase [Candidatus Epulonipiscium sp.]
MISKVPSCTLQGIEGSMIEVEVDLSEGLPSFDLVGLPDSAVRESKERVRSAIKNSGFSFPIKRITVNLAPAHIRKEGPAFDLPIALGILASSGIIPKKSLHNIVCMGELSLDGKIRPIHGLLSLVHCAYKNQFTQCMIPEANAQEGALIEGITLWAASDLKSVVAHLLQEYSLNKIKNTTAKSISEPDPTIPDFSYIKGQQTVKRALEIAAAGSHNVIMVGPPGSGKTMMARCLPGILPALTFEESMEITKIYSVAGLLPEKQGLISKRPFRAPHHTISPSALVGGGHNPKPGEVSLAHYGVLFLDELPEFKRNVLEMMRQPLEDGKVTIARNHGHYTYPSNFMLVAALNPCPCGFYPDIEKCTCTPMQIHRYLGKISGPLLDRIDLHVEAAAIEYEELTNKRLEESSQTIQKRVQKAVQIQNERFKQDTILFNAQMNPKHIEKYCILGKEESKLLETIFSTLDLSARAYHRILKVARTIADLEESSFIQVHHITEAAQYRNLDRNYNI